MILAKINDKEYAGTLATGSIGTKGCDFCGKLPIVAEYDCKDFDFPMGVVRPEDAEKEGAERFPVRSVGAWATCATCDVLITRSKFGELVDRIVEFYGRRNPEGVIIRQIFVDSLKLFRQHRGARRPYEWTALPLCLRQE